MPTDFPSALDDFTNPTGTDTLALPDHAAQHADINDAVEAIEAKLGTTVGHVTSKTGRGGTVIVASANALQRTKDQADYVCDGTADNVEIQAALDALPTQGGLVVLSEGRFNIASTIQVQKNGTAILGAGHGISDAIRGSVLWAASGLTGYVMDVHNAADTEPLGGIRLEGLGFQGSGGPALTALCRLRAYTSLVRGCTFRQCNTGHGLLITGYSGWSTYDCAIDSCWFQVNSGDGLQLGSPRGEDVQISNCIANANGQDNFSSIGSSNQFVNCHAYSAGRYGFSTGTASARVKITNCKIEHSQQHGIFLPSGSDSVIILGCSLAANGKGANNTYDNINCASSGTLISSCQNRINTGEAQTNLPRYGVNVLAGAGSSTLVIGNIFNSAGWGTGVLANAAGAMIRSNKNVADAN